MKIKSVKNWKANVLNKNKTIGDAIKVLNKTGIQIVCVVEKKNHFFSRIHVKDIAQTLYLSLNKSLNNDIYNLSDDKPASNIEVVKYACNLINFELPKIISFDELEEGMLKDFYKDSKKVSNKKIKDIFKLKLIYPTYEEGLKVNV